MRFLTGTSGWQYKEWRGGFYPEGLPVDRMLAHYAERLPAVEVNNTFYRLPKEDVLRGWAERVPADFIFVLKASRRITHDARLKEEAAAPLEYLVRTAGALGERLGPFLFQLPPNLKKDVPRLRDFVERLPTGTRAAFEFRHPSWHEDDDELEEVLRRRGVALCTTSDEGGDTPIRATAPYGYLRLRKPGYTEGELREWDRRIRAEPWSEAFAFFKHEEGTIGRGTGEPGSGSGDAGDSGGASGGGVLGPEGPTLTGASAALRLLALAREPA